MTWIRNACLCAALAGIAAGAANGRKKSENEEVAGFNARFIELHQKMDTAGVLALWAEDGTDLMPEETPILGRKNITAWVEDILSKMPGYKMLKEEVEFHDIQISGDWASEWATEHQIVGTPDGKPPIETYGKMILVLHREGSGAWKIKQEMWNSSPKP